MGRKFEQIGAHCLGWNDRSIGICYEGGLLNGKPFDTRTPQQRISIEKAIRYCLTKYPLIKNVYGHNNNPPYNIRKKNIFIFIKLWRLKGVGFLCDNSVPL